MNELEVLHVQVNQALLDGILDQFGDIVNVQLLHDVSPMRLHGFHADEKLLGHLAIGKAFRDELQHFSFPVGQEIKWGFGLAGFHFSKIGIYQRFGDSGA